VRRLLSLLLVAVAAAAALVWAGGLGIGPVLVTREGEQKMVLLFGNPMTIRTEPGLYGRIPLLTEVRTFESRLLYLNAEALPIQTRDKERIVVDNYVVWRISDPLLFYASFPNGLSQAEDRIGRTVKADLREVIGQRTLAEVVTSARVEIMSAITAQTREGLLEYGVVVEDVRINRTELPKATEENVYARMRAERERLARKYRAEGEEEGRRIRAEADRKARVIVAEAGRDATMLRGEGDADAARIYAEAYSSDPEFYGFARSLEAYRKTIDGNTTLVLPPDAEFFRLFGSGASAPAPPKPAPAPAAPTTAAGP
jgi:membrane protease subunit HflC